MKEIFSPKKCTLVNLPLFHTGGMHALVQPTLLRGGTAVIMGKGFEPEKVLDAVKRYRVTMTMWVPTMSGHAHQPSQGDPL